MVRLTNNVAVSPAQNAPGCVLLLAEPTGATASEVLARNALDSETPRTYSPDTPLVPNWDYLRTLHLGLIVEHLRRETRSQNLAANNFFESLHDIGRPLASTKA